MDVTYIEQHSNPCCERLAASDKKLAEEWAKCGIENQQTRPFGW